MGRALYRVGHFCAAHPLRVLLAWVVLAAGVVAAMSAVGSLTSNDLTLPGTQSQQASDLLATKFPPQQNGSSPIVFHAVKGKITDKDNKNAVEASYKALLKAPHVYSATDPFGSSSSALISTDDRTAFSPVLLNISSGQVTEELARRIFDATARGPQAGHRGRRRGNHRDRAFPLADGEQRGRGAAHGDADPRAHVRKLRRDGRADHYRRPRPGHGARRHRPAHPPVHGADGRTHAGDHDRAGRRHRLRAVPGQQVPGAPGARARSP